MTTTDETPLDADELAPEDHEPNTTPLTVEQFRAYAEEDLRRGNGDPESIAILLRHAIHPHGYSMAYEYMRVCAELTGEPLTADGVWERGARGELWLPKVLAQRAQGPAST